MVKAPYIPTPPIYLEAPDILELLKTFQANLQELGDSTVAHFILLQQTQIDVEQQFDTKQGEWKPNRPYTVKKKERRSADMRIMHESKTKGTRLRDAYAAAGEASREEMTWLYPLDLKPYAKDLDKGVTESQFADKPDKHEDNSFDDSRLDREYASMFNINIGSFNDLFKKPRVQRPKKTNAQKRAEKPRKKRKRT